MRFFIEKAISPSKAIVVLLLLFMISKDLSAQGTSNEGTDFWVAYAGHVDDTQSRLTLFLTSKTSASVQINLGGTPYPSTINLVANQPQAIVIDPNVFRNVYVDSYDNLEYHLKKGIHVTADNPIVVYSHISRGARSAACLVYPTKALGMDYYAISYDQLADQPQIGEIRASQFTIVGVEDNTEIEITPTQDSRWLPLRPANIPFTIKLNKGDIYQFQSKTDITGSRIKIVNSCKTFAVFSGSSKNGFCESGNLVTPDNPGGQDNLYQQLLPTAAWGRNFVTAPSFNAHKGNVDIYRIQVSTDNTIVTINGSTTNASGTALNNPYSKGSVITFSNQTANVISANNPINVTQFQTSQSCNAANAQSAVVLGDPEMIILNPIEQTLKDITVYSAISTVQAPTNITSHYINAIIKTADTATFSVDGVKFSSNPPLAPFAVNKFIRINSEYLYIVVDVTASSLSGRPTHRILADGGFVAIAYGYGNVESYGYLAGSDLKNLNQYIQPENAITKVPLVSGCKNDPVNLYVILPYKTSSLKWDLSDGKGIQVDPSPDTHFTTQTTNGITYYKYRYFNDKVNYTTPGIYEIKAMAVNPAPLTCDANETISLSLTILGLPTADFDVVSDVCQGDSATFSDKSSGNGLDLSKWIWDFGDGTAVETRKTAEPFQHKYVKAGDFKVKLIVESMSGCQSEFPSEKVVHIIEPPRSKFGFTGCDEVAFSDSSSTVEGNIVKWEWNFNDPGSGADNLSTFANPKHTFSKSSSFDVMLTVTTDRGCKNTFTDVVYSKPTVDAGADKTILVGGETTLDAIVRGRKLKYKWTPSLGLDADSVQMPVASPEQTTEYTLTVTANGTCLLSDKVQVKVVEPEVPNAFSPNADGVNDKWAIRYLETYVKAKVQVFNRYGQIIYSSGQYVNPWDGTYEGKDIPVGVYYYIIQPNNGRKNLVGSVTLVR